MKALNNVKNANVRIREYQNKRDLEENKKQMSQKRIKE